MLEADVVVLATGYRASAPACLDGLSRRLALETDGALALGANYRVVWDGPDDAPIYGLNQGRRSYGVIDPQLSMAAWRSAVVLNDLCERPVFRLAEAEPMVAWRPASDGTAQEAGRAPRLTAS